MISQIPSTVVGPPPPATGNYITILSIDGGGIKGIIPGVILEYLESQLQRLDGPEARIADYFDVIAGTSTGGLLTTMLTAPNQNYRPLFAAREIVPFYQDNCPKVFKQPWWPIATLVKLWNVITGPQYDGKYLKHLIEKLLGPTKLHQTLTNVVIPTFDIKNMEPVIFSSYEVSKNSSKNAKLSDICLGTSAAPTYLPAHYFKNYYDAGKYREYNLIDGGIVASNPSTVAIAEVRKRIRKEDPNFVGIPSLDCKRCLLISLGTGLQKKQPRYDAKMAAKWNLFEWIARSDSTSPLIEAFTEASSGLADFHEESIFKDANAADNYIRIQDYSLTEDLASMDLATTENLKNLENVGKLLLNKQATRANSDTGVVEPIPDGGTNRAALDRFARKLSDKRKLRKLNYYGGSA